MSDTPSISILIPAYCERLTIEGLIDRSVAVLAQCTNDYEVIVLDDASTDDTGEIASRAAARHPGARVERHERNMGNAATFEDLYRMASKDFVFLISGDGQFPPETLLSCLPLLDQHDIVICRRVAKKYTFYRQAISSAYRWLPRIAFGVDLVDPGSVKCVRREIYQKVPVRSKSVFVEAERLINALRRGYRLTSVDMVPEARIGGAAMGARLPVALHAASDFVRFALRSMTRPAVCLCLALAGAACSSAPVQSGAPSWTPAGQIVFYSENAGERADLYIMAADGSNVRQLTRTPTAAEGYPSASPDGRSIAYESDAASGNFDIWLMDANGFNPRRITDSAARDVAPAWSPDGRSMGFMSDRENREFDLYRMNADGTGTTRLTIGGTNWFPQFSPDGQRIALHVGRHVHLLNPKSGTLEPLNVGPLNGMYPSWSPDGKRLAFMSWRNGKTEIFLMNADGSDQRLLVSSALGSAIDPRWSPDGKLIVFVESSQVSPVAPPPANLESHISVVDLATGRVSRLR